MQNYSLVLIIYARFTEDIAGTAGAVTKGPPVSAALLLLTGIASLAAVGAVSTVIVTLRDGYRRSPSRHA
jgi:hypothetical protein